METTKGGRDHFIVQRVRIHLSSPLWVWASCRCNNPGSSHVIQDNPLLASLYHTRHTLLYSPLASNSSSEGSDGSGSYSSRAFTTSDPRTDTNNRLINFRVVYQFEIADP